MIDSCDMLLEKRLEMERREGSYLTPASFPEAAGSVLLVSDSEPLVRGITCTSGIGPRLETKVIRLHLSARLVVFIC